MGEKMTKVIGRRGGIYFEGNKQYVSVTHVLSEVLRKKPLEYWFGQQVYYAMLKDPSLDERTALAAPYKISESAADRGTTIHSLAESYKTSGKIIDTVPQQFKGYATALYKWIDDFKPVFIENEKRVFNDQHGYAGSLDAIIELNGKRLVLDLKTNKDGNVYTEAHLQVSAYINCLPDIDGGIIVALGEDGNYSHQTCKDGFTAFIHALELYKFLNQDKLKKLGAI
jgi:hypothetical protein